MDEQVRQGKEKCKDGKDKIVGTILKVAKIIALDEAIVSGGIQLSGAVRFILARAYNAAKNCFHGVATRVSVVECP